MDLKYHVNGFIWWIEAVELYKKEKTPIKEIYEKLAKKYKTNIPNIDYLMKYARKEATRNIRLYYEYKGKITNTIVLHLLVNFK